MSGSQTPSKNEPASLVLAVLSAILSLPLLLDIVLGLTTPIHLLFQLVIGCWFLSILVGIVAIACAFFRKEASILILAVAFVPFVVFLLSLLPIWPLFGPFGPIGPVNL